MSKIPSMVLVLQNCLRKHFVLAIVENYSGIMPDLTFQKQKFCLFPQRFTENISTFCVSMLFYTSLFGHIDEHCVLWILKPNRGIS